MQETQHKLLVLVTLGNAASSEQLARRLLKDGGLLPVTAEELAEGDHADVAIVDDETASGVRMQGLPLVVLASEATQWPATVAAVLSLDADTALIAAATRLAAAGYRVALCPGRNGWTRLDRRLSGWQFVGRWRDRTRGFRDPVILDDG